MTVRPDILHITPHLGGGVGRVLLNYLAAALKSGQTHRLICLDYANPYARKRAAGVGLSLRDRLGLNHQALARAVARADLIVIHWWNHPLIYAWLCAANWPPARIMLWSHVSGRTAPQIITPALADFPDILAVASPVSLGIPALARRPPEDRRPRPRLLFSSAGLDHLGDYPLKPAGGSFRIGYLGTVDYAKMHPDFIDLCLAADLDEAVFPVAGGPEHQALGREIRGRGLAARFELLGPVPDGPAFLAGLDILGYPLNPEHYGTGEQVLIEAQALGIPPVVLAGGAEEFVVEHQISGLVAQGAEDYGRCLRRLRDDAGFRRKLSARARERARERFGLAATLAAFDELYEELLARPKTGRGPLRPEGADHGKELEPWQIFMLSQGEAADFYPRLSADTDVEGISRAALSATRGSVFHYADFFPADERLRRWRDQLNYLRGRLWPKYKACP